MPRITALYAGLLLVLFLVLTFNVFRVRRAAGVVLGTGGNRALERAVRVHGNFTEYVPIFLVALFLAESCGTGAFALHAAGAAMLAGRAAHAAGVAREPDILALRGAGMLLTLIALLLVSGSLLRVGFGALGG